MIINKSGGGAGLKLKVVGGTAAPSSPRENTLWVNTDTEISGYVFAVNQPVNPVEGMVWIETSPSESSAPMDVGVKNTAMIYPIAAKQYIGGSWVDKVAQTYVNGEWLDWWDGGLYVAGDTYDSVTGGFVSVGFPATAPSVTYNANYVTLTQKNMTWEGLWRTNNLIDLSGFSKLSWTYSNWWIQDSENDLRLAVLPQNAADISAAAAYLQRKNPSDGGTYTVTLDVSALNGKYYLGIYMYVRYGDQTINVHDLHLER